MVLILGIMLLIPGIQVSVYAIPVWLLVMYVAYLLKGKQRPQANGAVPTGSVAQPSSSLNGMKGRLSPTFGVLPSRTSTRPSAQAALRSTPELWFL